MQSRRVIRIMLIVLLALSLSLIKSLTYGLTVTGATLALAAVVIGVACVIALRGNTMFAASLMLCCLSVMLSVLAIRNQGVRDEALLAFPALMVLAALLGSRRLMWGIAAWMVAMIATMAFLRSEGWYAEPVPSPGSSAYIDVTIILLVTAFSVAWLASDLRKAMLKLRDDHQQLLHSQAEISHLAHHDLLTGLPNRMLVRDRFDMAAARAHRQPVQIALLFIDLDNFKTVNDSGGHLAGDILLRAVATAIHQTVRNTDTVSRHGGDEFLVLLEHANGEAVATQVAGKIIEAVERVGREAHADASVSCSIGVAMFPRDASSFDELLKYADIAMYAAKHAGRRQMCFYEPGMAHGQRRVTARLADPR